MRLEDLIVSDFDGRIGDAFRIHVPELPEPLDGELIEAEPTGGPGPGTGRAPFSLVFRGPWEPVLPQGVYEIEHDALGSAPIFLVPIGRNPMDRAPARSR